jgi:hypothetical protein
MQRFADEAARHGPPGAPTLLHGYELGPTARRRPRAEQLTWRQCAEAHDRFLRGEDAS